MIIYPKYLLFVFSAALITTACNPGPTDNNKSISDDPVTGSVIFIHPDGSGAAMWGALRLVTVGPNGMTNWDRMQHMGIYRMMYLTLFGMEP